MVITMVRVCTTYFCRAGSIAERGLGKTQTTEHNRRVAPFHPHVEERILSILRRCRRKDCVCESRRGDQFACVVNRE